VAGKAAPGNLVATTFVHWTLDRPLEAAVDTGACGGTRLHVHARPVIVSGRTGDHLHHPDVVVVDVHQAGDDAAVFGMCRRVRVRVGVRPGLDRLTSAHVLHTECGDDRLQPFRMDRVVVVLRPARLRARHEMPAVEVEDEGARTLAFRDAV